MSEDVSPPTSIPEKPPSPKEDFEAYKAYLSSDLPGHVKPGSTSRIDETADKETRQMQATIQERMEKAQDNAKMEIGNRLSSIGLYLSIGVITGKQAEECIGIIRTKFPDRTTDIETAVQKISSLKALFS